MISARGRQHVRLEENTSWEEWLPRSWPSIHLSLLPDDVKEVETEEDVSSIHQCLAATELEQCSLLAIGRHRNRYARSGFCYLPFVLSRPSGLSCPRRSSGTRYLKVVSRVSIATVEREPWSLSADS